MSRPNHGGPRLELRDVELAAGPTINLRVDAGEMIALDGWMGSDLLTTIAGLQPCSAGEVLVDGAGVGEPSEALAAGVALISEANPVPTLLTAYENVLLPVAESWTEADPTTVAREALASVGLTDSADHLTEELSGGQQQRVAVARAVALQPRLLLADQATTDLDAGNRNRVIGLLRKLAVAGSAVLIVSDDPAVVAACDRTVRTS